MADQPPTKTQELLAVIIHAAAAELGCADSEMSVYYGHSPHSLAFTLRGGSLRSWIRLSGGQIQLITPNQPNLELELADPDCLDKLTARLRVHTND